VKVGVVTVAVVEEVIGSGGVEGGVAGGSGGVEAVGLLVVTMAMGKQNCINREQNSAKHSYLYCYRLHDDSHERTTRFA